MKIVIAGAGEVGTHLAKLLSIESHEIVVIDTDIERLNNLDSHLEVITINGSSVSPETLQNAQVKGSDLFIAVTPTQEMNITSAILSKKLGAKKTIARIDTPEYLHHATREIFQSLGIDSLIYPEQLAAEEVVALLNQSGTRGVVDFSGGMLSLVVLSLDDQAPVLNKTLEEASRMSADLDYRAVAITRNGRTLIPRGHDRFQLNDKVYVITNNAGLQRLLKFSGKVNVPIRNVMIIGGSRIGTRIAKELETRCNVKLIEIDRDKSFRLADELANTMVIRGNGSEIDLLIEEGIKEMDAFIAVTGNSETNILTCLQARKLKVKKTIAEVENVEYIRLAENIGIDSMINKKFIAASHIFGFTMNAQVSSVKCLTGTEAELIEIIAKPGTRIVKAPLKDLDFPEQAIIGGVIRDRTGFIARGATEIKPNDRVILFSMPSAIPKVEKFFK